ncbi:MAG: aldolase/citrate lyase family protein [Pseudomonadota bacterium]
MPAPTNHLKQRLLNGETTTGLWLGFADPYLGELSARAGFDWVVVDNEHSPNDIKSTAGQLQAIEATPTEAVVRPVIGETWLIKQLLDVGAQTFVMPMVETADQAGELVRATRYPPDGVRGVGAALARASRFNAIPDYLQTANDQICNIMQIESAAAVEHIEAIAGVDGVDGLFVGPADLSADIGFLGRAFEPEPMAYIDAAIKRILATGKFAGILTGTLKHANHYIDLGATFVGVGTDITCYGSTVRDLAAQFGSRRDDQGSGSDSPY